LKENTSRTPNDIESERVVLGAIICGHPQTVEIFEKLTPEDFFDSRHKVIFTTLRSMWDAGHPTGLPALHDALNARNVLENVGGIAYVSACAEPIPEKLKVDKYASMIRTSYVRREFYDACGSWLNLSQRENISDVLESARTKICDLSQLSSTEDSGKSFRDASVNLAAGLRSSESFRLITGIPEVDERTGGFRSGEVGILTAETGVGKTFFALQIARKSCSMNRHLLYCSGEMLAEHLMGRVLSSKTNVPYQKFRSPQELREHEYMEILDLAVKQCPDCRVLDGEISLQKIRVGARAMLSDKFGGVIVDYDELVEVRGKDEWEQQRILIRSLKSLAMEMKIPVLVVSQLRKALNPEERRNPTLQRLYGSGAKAKHASIVLYVDRPFVQNLEGDETEAKIYVLKSRDGRMGQTKCTFNIRTLTFEEGYEEKPHGDWHDRD